MGKNYKTVGCPGAPEIVVYGKNLKELFESAAFGMFTLIARPNNECKKKTAAVTVTAANTEKLLVAFLKELLHYYSVRKILLCGFKVMFLSENKVHAKLTGEEISRHEILNDIKTIGQKDLKIVKTRTGYKTGIIFNV